MLQVKGCGCRYRVNDAVEPHQEHCEHLCDKHKERFILQKYNDNLILNRMIEEDALAMDEMNKQRKQLEEKDNS